MSTPSKIIYTFTDEAPALATYSLLPIVKAFAEAMGMSVTAANRPDGKGAIFALRFPPALLLRDVTMGSAD